MGEFTEAIEERGAEKMEPILKKLIKDLISEVFFEVLAEYRHRLPLMVISFPHGNFFSLATFIGHPDFVIPANTDSLLQLENHTTTLNEDDNRATRVIDTNWPENLDELENLFQELTISVDKLLEKKEDPYIEVPRGFMVFRFSAQWAAGGYDEEPVIKRLVIEADSLEEAESKVTNRLLSMREIAFWDFEVALPGEKSNFQPLKVTIYYESMEPYHIHRGASLLSSSIPFLDRAPKFELIQ